MGQREYTTLDKADDASPWPTLPTTQTFMRMLVGGEGVQRGALEAVAVGELARWLIGQGLGAMAFARFKEAWPELAEALRGDAYMAALEQRLWQERQAQVHEALAKAGIPIVPLKGAALALTVYDDAAWRPMSDVDYWVRDGQMNRAIRAMQQAGYQLRSSLEERPPALQKLFDGEVQLVGPDQGLVELHWSPFSGWWLQGAARVDNEGLWKRLQPLAAGNEGGAPDLMQLAPEDLILQLAVHVSVNHKFGIWPVRSLLDIYLVATRNAVDWQALVARAYRWRLATVTWTVLQLVRELFALELLAPVLRALQPSPWRRRMLQRVMPLETVVADSDLREQPLRFALLLLLVDRPTDMLRLCRQMLWPNRRWLEARYGDENPGNLRHLWRVVREREI